MAEDSIVFVRSDVAKLKHAIAVAEPGRSGEVRYIGEVEASPKAMHKLLTRLAARHGKLQVCYEAGPTGYGLYRQVVALGHARTVVAPSLIPRKPGDRVKTDRRDAVASAQLLRAGELTVVCGPDEAHEAMHDALRELILAARHAKERLKRIEAAVLEIMRQLSSPRGVVRLEVLTSPHKVVRAEFFVLVRT